MTTTGGTDAHPRAFVFNHPDKDALEDTLSRRWDIERAKGSVRLLIGPPARLGGAGLLASALYTHALIAYVRCFSTGRRQPLAKDVFSDAPNLLVRHERYKGIRDKHLSHAVDESENVALLVAANDEKSPALGIGLRAWFFAGDDDEGLRRLLELIEHVEQYLHKQEQILGDRIACDLMGEGATWESAKKSFSRALSYDHNDPVFGPTKVR